MSRTNRAILNQLSINEREQLNKLPAKYKAVYELSIIESLPIEVACKKLGISYNSLKGYVISHKQEFNLINDKIKKLSLHARRKLRFQTPAYEQAVEVGDSWLGLQASQVVPLATYIRLRYPKLNDSEVSMLKQKAQLYASAVDPARYKQFIEVTATLVEFDRDTRAEVIKRKLERKQSCYNKSEPSNQHILGTYIPNPELFTFLKSTGVKYD